MLDLRGTLDDDGSPLHATVLAVADELAAGAGLAMGKTDRTPVVLARGLRLEGHGTRRELIRPPAGGLFRWRTSSWRGGQAGVGAPPRPPAAGPGTRAP